MARKRKRLWFQKLVWPDFFADTKYMNGFEQGIYLVLIGNYFMNRGPLPDDDQRLALMSSLTVEQWLSVRPPIEKKFEIKNGLWHHDRIERDLADEEAEHQGKSEGARITHAKQRAKQRAEHTAEQTQLQSQSHSQSESVPEGTERVKAVTNGVENALELADEEELMRRTRDLVGEEEMRGRKYYFWRTLARDCAPAYRDALADAESRKKEAARGIPEAQIKKTWAHYLTYQFKEMKKAYAKAQS